MFNKFAQSTAAFAALLFGVQGGEPGAANIVFVTLDDVGFNDIGSLGAEWDTPNFDNFLKESVSMTHHYSGYSDSASRSQILTGLHSWHTGYGRQASSFTTNTIAGLPLSVPTMAEYLKQEGNYDTFYIGAWGLGHTIAEHTPNARYCFHMLFSFFPVLFLDFVLRVLWYFFFVIYLFLVF